ncbi:MAG TPA: hypothetical protein VKR30_06170 [Candidatus Limnocylindrales bacterium]|nr:hypothetical protein [Candidatus Limnocylindrales bacterium]
MATAPSQPHAGAVYIDGWHALVARSTAPREVADLVRSWESEPDFVARVAHAADDCDCLVILGPGRECRDLEHAFGVLYQRPHLVDIEAAAAVRPADLLDRVRMLDGLSGATSGPASGAVRR